MCVKVCVVDVIDATKKDLHLLYQQYYHRFVFYQTSMQSDGCDRLCVLYILSAACAVAPTSLHTVAEVNDAIFTG